MNRGKDFSKLKKWKKFNNWVTLLCSSVGIRQNKSKTSIQEGETEEGRRNRPKKEVQNKKP